MYTFSVEEEKKEEKKKKKAEEEEQNRKKNLAIFFSFNDELILQRLEREQRFLLKC